MYKHTESPLLVGVKPSVYAPEKLASEEIFFSIDFSWMVSELKTYITRVKKAIQLKLQDYLG
jgi:hypothetical protein